MSLKKGEENLWKLALLETLIYEWMWDGHYWCEHSDMREREKERDNNVINKSNSQSKVYSKDPRPHTKRERITVRIKGRKEKKSDKDYHNWQRRRRRRSKKKRKIWNSQQVATVTDHWSAFEHGYFWSSETVFLFCWFVGRLPTLSQFWQVCYLIFATISQLVKIASIDMVCLLLNENTEKQRGKAWKSYECQVQDQCSVYIFLLLFTSFSLPPSLTFHKNIFIVKVENVKNVKTKTNKKKETKKERKVTIIWRKRGWQVKSLLVFEVCF